MDLNMIQDAFSANFPGVQVGKYYSRLKPRRQATIDLNRSEPLVMPVLPGPWM